MTQTDLERIAVANGGKVYGCGPVAVQAKPVAGKRPQKYKAQRTEYAGVMYASKAEAAYAQYLDAGTGIFWVPQPKFRLGCPENVYVADFLVSEAFGDSWVVDVKGMETPKFKRDKKLWAKYGPCELRIIKGGKLVEVIKGGKAP